MIYNFLDSNLFQTLVLIATAVITLWIYRARQKNELRSAAKILILQIRDIENNIEYLLSEVLLMDLFKKNHCIILQ